MSYGCKEDGGAKLEMQRACVLGRWNSATAGAAAVGATGVIELKRDPQNEGRVLGKFIQSDGTERGRFVGRLEVQDAVFVGEYTDNPSRRTHDCAFMAQGHTLTGVYAQFSEWNAVREQSSAGAPGGAGKTAAT